MKSKTSLTLSSSPGRNFLGTKMYLTKNNTSNQYLSMIQKEFSAQGSQKVTNAERREAFWLIFPLLANFPFQPPYSRPDIFACR